MPPKKPDVAEHRRSTARERRAGIIAALRRDLTLDQGDVGKAARFARLLADEPRTLVVNADIDGIVAAHMLAAVSSWRIGVLVDRRGGMRWHPSITSPEDLVESGRAFGVDVFSLRYPGVSNHPVLFGAGKQMDAHHAHILTRFDDDVRNAVEEHGLICPSAWVGIAAAHDAGLATGMPYKYPLGTAQVMLALLETVDRNPRFFDRQFLPYLVANCDGGLESIRKYAWNVEPWWSALAACVGPGSLTDSLYQLATQQRPSETGDVDRRFRWEEPERSKYLNQKWNLTSAEPPALTAVASLLQDLSGWEDPYLGGSKSLSTWTLGSGSTGVLPIGGITKRPSEQVKAHLEGARRALHMNFSQFPERGVALGWVLGEVDSDLEAAVGGDTLASLGGSGPALTGPTESTDGLDEE